MHIGIVRYSPKLRIVIISGEDASPGDHELDSNNSSTKNTNTTNIKMEENGTDSDLDPTSNFSNATRNAPSWYPCDGQI